MKTRAAVLVFFLAATTYAGPPEWTELGTADDLRINVALNKKKSVGKQSFTVPMCMDSATEENKKDCSVVTADCGNWTLMGVLAGPGTAAELVLKAVCPK